MIHVDALDFSEWHSEEVISFFWRSVYKHKGMSQDAWKQNFHVFYVTEVTHEPMVS